MGTARKDNTGDVSGFAPTAPIKGPKFCAAVLLGRLCFTNAATGFRKEIGEG